MLFERSRIAPILTRLASESGVYLGTTSWRFRGWCGTLYDEDRYLWGTHFSTKRFNEHCLEEYAAVFKSVEVDSTYYALPKLPILLGIADQVPGDFRFSFKVPDKVTIKTYPKAKSFGKLAGQPNEFFLSDGVFTMGFLRHLEKIRPKIGMLVFEFSHFHPNDFGHGREFVDALDRFFEKLPSGWRYAVEVRNQNLLHPDYFAMLAKHRVAHVYNQWTRMPSISEQIELHPPEENPFIAARYLLTPGRSFEWARERFEPFNRICEIDPSARESFPRLIEAALRDPARRAFVYIGNDLEGNALHTIADVLEKLNPA